MWGRAEVGLRGGIGLSCLFIALAAAPVEAGAASTPSLDKIAVTAEPGVMYGIGEDASLPKTLVFSATPDNVIAHAEEWHALGIDGFFLNKVVREWSDDVWATDGKPWTIGESDATFQKTRKANAICQRLGMDTFLKIAFDNPFDWFNDLAWQQINHHFRQFGIFARETGCTGVAIDIEYVNEQYTFDWEGYTYDGYTRSELVERVRARMTGAIQGLYDEFPEMVLLTLPEQGLMLGAHIQAAWIEEAARRNAPGGVHCCIEHTYRNPNVRHALAYVQGCSELFRRLLSEDGAEYWLEKCSISVGVWPFGFGDEKRYAPGMSVEEFRQGLAGSLMVSRRYNWIYSHHGGDVLVGGGLEPYGGQAVFGPYLEVLTDRQVIAMPKYATVAGKLREMSVEDYSQELSVAPVMSFMGPHDLPLIQLIPALRRTPRHIEDAWTTALAYSRGEVSNLHEHYATQTRWLLIGPFASGRGLSGHEAVYPPETGIDLTGEYDGVAGKVRWLEHRQTNGLSSVDLTKVFQPTENVCAYALCYVTSPTERNVQFRLGTNDSGKVWLGGQLVYDYPHEGAAFLDRDVVPVVLAEGTTPILLKVCNGGKNWGFVFRITEADGRPAKGLDLALEPAV